MLYFSTETYPNKTFSPFLKKTNKGNVGNDGGLHEMSFQELLQKYRFFDCEMSELPRCPESKGRGKRTQSWIRSRKSRVRSRKGSRKQSKKQSKKRLFVYYPGINLKKLKQIFEKYGTLKDLYVVKMKPSTIGFVEFQKEEQAQKARQEVHLTTYNHQKIKVQFAKVRS